MGKRTDIRKTINGNIEYYKRICDLRSKDVAEIMGVSQATVSRRMNIKDDGAFDVLQLQRFAEKCKCSVVDLVTPKEEAR